MDEHNNLLSCNILSEDFIEHAQKINFQKIKMNLACWFMGKHSQGSWWKEWVHMRLDNDTLHKLYVITEK